MKSHYINLILKLFFVFLFSQVSIISFSQQLNNSLIGYQEPETRILAHTVDSNGNFYYLGNFKGELVIKGEIKAIGNGGQDIFLAKTDSAGNLLWVKTYGDAGDDLVGGPGKQLIFHNGRLYFLMYTQYNANIGGLNAMPYDETFLTSFILQADESGDLKWIKRNNLLNFNGLFANRGALYIMNLFYGSTGGYYEDVKVIESSDVLFKNVTIKIDTLGNYLTSHIVYSEAPPDYFALFPFFKNTQVLNANSFISLVQLYENKLKFGSSTLTINNTIDYNLRSVIIKYDSNFNVSNYKVLNPTGESINAVTSFEGDNIEMIFNSSGNSGNFQLDGTPIDIYGNNVWITLDQNLNFVKQVNLGKSQINSYNSINYESIQKCGDKYLINGSFLGQNEAYDSSIHGKTTQNIQIFSDQITRPFNLNGPSSQFIISCNKDLSAPKYLNKGSLELYELSTLSLTNTAYKNRLLSTAYSYENIWNPWIIDTNLNVITGSMQKNADRQDGSSNVRFLRDGSKYLLVSAKGKTSIDSNTSTSKNSAERTDILISRLDTNNKVIWYKRIQSSWRVNQVAKAVVKNDTLYIGINCIGDGNKTINILKIDSLTYTFNFQTKAIIKITKEGKVSMLSPDFNIETTSFDVTNDQDLYFVKGSNIYKYDRNFILKDSIVLSGVSDNYFYGSSISAAILTNSDSSLTIDFPVSFTDGSGKNISYKLNGVITDNITLTKPAAGSVGTYMGVVNIKNGKFRWKHVIGPLYSKMTTQVNNRYTSAINYGEPCYFDETLIAPLSGTMLIQLNKEGTTYRTKETSNWSWGGIQGLGSYRNYLFTTGSAFQSGNIDGLSYTNDGGGDGLGVLFDTTLAAVRLLKLSSPIDEKLNDIDIYNDTLVSFAYDAQGEVTFSSVQRTAEISASTTNLLISPVNKVAQSKTIQKGTTANEKHNRLVTALISNTMNMNQMKELLLAKENSEISYSSNAPIASLNNTGTVKPSDRNPNAYVSTLKVDQNFLPKYYSIEGGRLCNSTESNLSIYGGNPPFQYSWTGPNKFTAATLNIKARAQGPYTLTVTDASNWSITKSFNLETLKLKVVKNEVPRDCGKPFASSIILSGIGGTAPYTYKFENNPVFSTTTNFTALAPKTYLYMLKDADNCMVTDSAKIADLDLYEVNNTLSTSKPIILNELKNGRISFSGDIDWFSFFSLASTDYKISLTSGPGVSMNFDLYTSSGILIKPKNSTSSGSVSEKYFALKSGTSYRIKLSSNQFSTEDINCYTLAISVAANLLTESNRVFSRSFKDDNGAQNIEIAPNPSTGVFHLNFGSLNSSEWKLTVTNSIGQLIKNININSGISEKNYKIDLRFEPRGIYFMNLQTREFSKTIKLVVE